MKAKSECIYVCNLKKKKFCAYKCSFCVFFFFPLSFVSCACAVRETSDDAASFDLMRAIGEWWRECNIKSSKHRQCWHT